MSLLTATGLAKSFGAEDIFAGISLSIPYRARIAIVGPNGIGKTTLLRILVGLDEPSAGNVHTARNLNTGYLPQEARLVSTSTLWEECLSVLTDLLSQEVELSRLEEAMADPKLADEALERYGKLQEEFERQGGYIYQTHIRQVLTGLGFSPQDYHRPIQHLSGGERTRAMLAKLLLSSPDLLVLDEPTNHLDINAVEWLEGYLSQWDGAALIVSHDRYFLDKVVDHIWEMDASGLEVYRGNYSAYVSQRQERWELRQQVFEAEKARLEKELDYIKRNIAGQNTTQAKGKLRRLSREVQAIEILGFEAVKSQSWLETSQQVDISSNPMRVSELEKRIQGLRSPLKRPPHLHLNLKTDLRSGDLVLRTRTLAIGYQDEGKPLFNSPDLLLMRGECVAVIGPNGAGKTTFLKTLLEQIPPLEGEVILGASLNIGYFAQAHEDLCPECTLVEEIHRVSPAMLLSDVRDYLARFLFTGEDVFKQVSTLSGGERGRLALAKLSLSQANLLLLDEPTNHLDIPSQEILQEVLAEYQGTILLVSHDRYLIDALCTQIWEILPDQTNLQVFEGSYTRYREHLNQIAAEGVAKVELVKGTPSHRDLSRRDSSRGDTRPPSGAAEQRRRRARLEKVEEAITDLEKQLASLSLRLENPPSDPEEVHRLGSDYVRIQDALDTLLIEWESLHDETAASPTR